MITMRFISIRDALITLLGDNQGTGWDTVGFLDRDQSAKKVNEKRIAEVYYNGGDFGRNNSSQAGPIQHDMKFHIILTVSETAKIDFTALEVATTDPERAAILALSKRAVFEADRSMDDFISQIWLLIMAPENRNLGIDISSNPRIGNRWIPNVRKEQPKREGEFCTMRAMVTLGGLIPEDIAGVTPGIEYTVPPYEGTLKIKDNIDQSGNADTGTPA